MSGTREYPFIRTCSPQGWHIEGDEYVGSGMFGHVYRACKDQKCDYVAKIIPYITSELDSLNTERDSMEKLGQLGFAPRLRQAILCDDINSLAKIIHEPENFLERIKDDIKNMKERLERKTISEKLKKTLQERIASPHLGILFSDYIKRTKPAKIEDIRPAVTELLDALFAKGYYPDIAGENNLLPYLENKKWKVKLVDVGMIRPPSTSITLTPQERQSFIDTALANMCNDMDFPDCPTRGEKSY